MFTDNRGIAVKPVSQGLGWETVANRPAPARRLSHPPLTTKEDLMVPSDCGRGPSRAKFFISNVYKNEGAALHGYPAELRTLLCFTLYVK